MVFRSDDPDEYAACVRAARVEPAITGRGRFAAKLVRVDLHRLWMQGFSEILPRILHYDLVPGRAIIAFPRRAGPSTLWDGVELAPTAIIRFREGQSGFQRSTGQTHFGSMS